MEDQLPPGGRGPLTPGLSSVGLAPLACNEMPCPAERGSRGKGALLRDVGCVREQEWGRQQEAEAGLPGACWDAAEMGEALRGVGGALRREPGTWGGWGEAGRGTVASLSPQTTSSWVPRALLMVRDKIVLSTPLPFCQGVWVESRLRWELLSASGVQLGQGLLLSRGPLFFSCCCWGHGLGAPGPQRHHLAAVAKLAVMLGTELFFQRAPLDPEHSQGIQ